MSKIKATSLLIIAFIFVIQIGALFTETIKIVTAKRINYAYEYVPNFGRNIYYNITINDTFESKVKIYGNDYKKLKKSKEWKYYENIDYRGHLIIELTEKIFTFSIAIFSLIFLFLRRKKNVEFIWKDWVLVFFSLFFMREVILSLFYIVFKFMPCGEAKGYFYLNLPIFYSMLFFAIIGTIIFLLGFKLISNDLRLNFLLSGFIGFILGIIVWLTITTKVFYLF